MEYLNWVSEHEFLIMAITAIVFGSIAWGRRR
jgi:hypothetical protein